MVGKWIWRSLGFVTALLLVLLAGVVGALLALDIPANAAGMAAKGICSAAFIAQRPWQTLLADDVLPASAALKPIGVVVDEANKSVTARFAGLFARQAQRVPDRGCVLDLPKGQPAPPATAARASTAQQPWPQGEAAVPPNQWGPGVDAKALQQLAQDAFVGAGDPQRANARGIAVVHKGRLLVLQMAPGFAPSTPLHGWSMTKTVLGMLSFKLAQETGLMLDTPVVDAFGKQREPA